MTSLLSVYWGPAHKAERPGDIEYIAALQPYDVLILDPGVGDVLDAHRASSDSEITLRYWWLDDGRGEGNPGIYPMLRDDPEACAAKFVAEYKRMIDEIMDEARRAGIRTLEREQLVAHMVNEPDTNHLIDQINIFTEIVCREFREMGTTIEALNLPPGHPVQQLGGEGSDVDYALLEPALEAIEKYGHYAVTHEYFNDLGIRHESVYPWHIGRADKWMPRGPKRKIGEFGLEMLLNNRRDNHHGWQGITSKEQYVADIDWYLGQCRDDVCSVRIF